MEKTYLTPKEAAEHLGCSKSFLDAKRLTGGGPTYSRLGSRSVRYSRKDLDAWMESRRAGSTTEEAVRG